MTRNRHLSVASSPKKIQLTISTFILGGKASPTPMEYISLADVPMKPACKSIRCIEPPLPLEQPQLCCNRDHCIEVTTLSKVVRVADGTYRIVRDKHSASAAGQPLAPWTGASGNAFCPRDTSRLFLPPPHGPCAYVSTISNLIQRCRENSWSKPVVIAGVAGITKQQDLTSTERIVRAVRFHQTSFSSLRHHETHPQ